MKKESVVLSVLFLALSITASGCRTQNRRDANGNKITKELHEAADGMEDNSTTQQQDSARNVAQTSWVPRDSDITSQVTWGYRQADRKRNDIDIIVVHSNYHVVNQAKQQFDFDVNGCIKQFRDGGTSAHYMITRDGTILKMVDEKNVAYHAGKSALPDGSRQWLNGSSIGIEVISMKRDGPTEAQYRSLDWLIKDICARYDIRYLVRHSDIAVPQGRKDDPWGMDWKRVCENVKAKYPNITTYNIPVKNNPQFK